MQRRSIRTAVASGMVTLSLAGMGTLALAGIAGPRAAVALPGSSALAAFANNGKDSSSTDAISKASALVPSYSYKVKAAGKFEAKKDDIDFSADAATVKKDGGKQLIASDGKPVMSGKVFSSIDYWGSGVYRVTAKDGGTGAVGLARIDGKTLLPCEAATINAATYDPKDARFVVVAYATDKAKDKSEAFLYSSKDRFYLGPMEDATLYKGYSKVFDLQKGAFVDGVKITTPGSDVTDLGTSFAVKEGDTTTLYDESGKVLWREDDGNTYVYSRGIVWSKDSKRQLIDASGKERYTTNETIAIITAPPGWAGGDYATVEVKDGNETKHRVIDFDGNAVFDKAYHRISYSNGQFMAQENSSDNDYKLLDKDGKVVADKVTGEWLSVCPGYNSVRLPSREWAIYKGAKKIAEGEGVVDFTEKLISIQDNKCLILNTGSYGLEADNLEAVDMGLVKGRQSDSMKYGVYDAFTGKRLTEDKYDIIKSAGGLVFTYDDGTWTVYKPELTQ